MPSNSKDGCSIFEERYLWYKHTKNSYEKWGIPKHIQLAIIQRESNFNWLAKPERKSQIYERFNSPSIILNYINKYSPFTHNTYK